MSPRPYIAINAAALSKKNKTGVEWYSWQLLKYLAREWKESDPQVVLFIPYNSLVEMENAPSLHKNNKNWRIKILPGKFLWTQYHLAKFLKRFPPALLFSPAYIAPSYLPQNIQTINVVHGLEGELFPEFRTVKEIILDYLFTIPTLKKSTQLIAVSEHTKKDLNHFYNIPLEQIQTVLSGPGTIDDNEIKSPMVNKSNKIIQFLFIDGARERKNLITALKIFIAVKNQTKRDIRLSIIGNYRKINPSIKKIIQAEKKKIRWIGYVSETNKKQLLKSSHFLLYPSFYEGFGFPLLESQAYGTIPIVLKNSGLKEIGGKGIIELEISSKNDYFGLKLVKLLENPTRLRNLRRLCRDNVGKYSWHRCAREIKKILLESAF